MAKKFTAKQKAWRGALAIAIAVACLSIAPLLAIGDQPFVYQVTDEMAAENAGISTTAESEEVVSEKAATEGLLLQLL